MIIDYYYTDDNGNDFLIREFDRMNYTLFSAENHSFTYHDTMRSATIAMHKISRNAHLDHCEQINA